MPYFYINNVNVSNNFPTSDDQVRVNYGKYDSWSIVNNGSINDSTVTINGVVFTFKTVPVAAYDVDVSDPIYNLYKAVSTNSNASLTVGGYNYDSVSDTLVVNAKFGVMSAPIGTTLIIAATTPDYSSIEKFPQLRYGNTSKVRMEIRYGKDNSVFELSNIYVDYLKSPKFVRLTESEVDEVEDNSQIIEFPDYVCQEVVNELVTLLMENSSDPRIQSQIPVNQSIASPQPQQPQQ